MKLEKTREAMDIVQFGTGVNRDSDFAEVRAELDAAESLLRDAATLRVFVVAGLSAFHGRLCSMATDTPMGRVEELRRTGDFPGAATECTDERCRAWAAVLAKEGP